MKKFVISLILFFPLAVGAQSAAPAAKVFDLSGKVKSDFTFFDPTYSGGVEMALGDINGDGLKEIILCPGSGSKANVKSYSEEEDVEVDSGKLQARSYIFLFRADRTWELL